MSLRNAAQDIEQAGVHGMDSTSPVQSVEAGYVVSAKNARPGLRGGWIKRDGYSEVLDTAWGARDITAGIDYKVSGARRPVLFGTTGGGTGGEIGWNNGGTVTSIETGLSGTARASFFQFDALLFFMNGANAPVVYDGTSTRQMGITAPTAAPTESSQSTNGELVQTASYVYAYTYYNSATGAESSPSPLLTVTLTSSNDEVNLGLTAGDSDTADTIRIYRTVANGNTLFLEGTEVIGATTHNSIAADSALTTQIEFDNTRITTWSGAPEFPLVAQDRVFVKTGTNEIRFSKIGQSGPMPESFEAKSFIPTKGSLGDSDAIIGLAKAGETPIVLKERSVGACFNVGIRSLSLAVDQEAFVYQELTNEVEPVAATEIFGECIFLAKDNIYGTRGQKGDLRPVGNDIASDIESLGFASAQISRISAANDPEEKLIYFAVFENSATGNPNIIICGDYRRYPEIRWSLWTPGTDTGTHPGIQAGSLFSITSSSTGKPEMVFGNVAGNGQYYKLNDGTNDDGSGIYFEITSRPYHLGRALDEKLYKDATFFIQGDGTDYDVTVSTIYDLSGEETGEQTFSLAAGGATWDVSEWDSAQWASNQVLPRVYNAHRKATYQQLVFRQTDADAPVTLFGWGTTGSIFGPR